MKDSNEKNKQLVKLPEPLDRNQRESHRDDLENIIKLKKKNPPVFKIKISDLLELIKDSSSDEYLNFFLASYRDKADVKRYNDRAGTNWTLDDLKHNPTLFVGLENEQLTSGDVYDIAMIKPPPEEN
jgi:hypothetical protein